VMEGEDISLGFDFGTSGARCAAVTASGEQVGVSELKWSCAADAADPGAWLAALDELLQGLPKRLRAMTARVCVGGTSSSCLLVDAQTGQASRATPGEGARQDSSGVRMYDWALAEDGRDVLGTQLVEEVVAVLGAACPPGHTARAGTSTLAKLVAWILEEPLGPNEVLAHQADYVAAHLWSGLDSPRAAQIAPTLLGRAQATGKASSSSSSSSSSSAAGTTTGAGGDSWSQATAGERIWSALGKGKWAEMHIFSSSPSSSSSSSDTSNEQAGFITEWHNALKLGFDVGDDLRYPVWLVGYTSGEEGSKTGGGGGNDATRRAVTRKLDAPPPPRLPDLLARRAADAAGGRRELQRGKAGGKAKGADQAPAAAETKEALEAARAAAGTALPRVLEPGRAVGRLTDAAVKRWGLGVDLPEAQGGCQLVLGTTDSIAAFLASGASEPGQAVTSLGSTLAIKLLSRARVDDSARGVYSHRFKPKPEAVAAAPTDEKAPKSQGQGGKHKGALWLVGGASNVGCAVLRQEGFTNEELVRLSLDLDPSEAKPARKYRAYYPLPGRPGERFPVNDPAKAPVLEPKPEGYPDRDGSRAEYLDAILHAITGVEAAGFAALREMGADELREVLTAGGGASNAAWTEMRARRLGVPTARAQNVEASYGLALLANWDRPQQE